VRRRAAAAEDHTSESQGGDQQAETHHELKPETASLEPTALKSGLLGGSRVCPCAVSVPEIWELLLGNSSYLIDVLVLCHTTALKLILTECVASQVECVVGDGSVMGRSHGSF
jgi:hypothetical protein